MGRSEELLAEGHRALEDYQHTRSPARLDAAVSALNGAVDGPWADTMDQVSCIFSLVEALAAGATAGSDKYTNQLIEVTGNVLQIRDGDPYLLSTRGYGAMLRFARHGNPADVDAAVADFSRSVDNTPATDAAKYMRAVNLAWAGEARFDRLGARGEDYAVVQIEGVERWRGPKDLVIPMANVEHHLQYADGSKGGPACSPGVIPRMKRNLANLYWKYAVYVAARPDKPRQDDMTRAVRLMAEALEEALALAEIDALDVATVAQGVVSLIDEGTKAGLLPNGPGIGPDVVQVARAVIADPKRAASEPAVMANFRYNEAARLGSAGKTDEASSIWLELISPEKSGTVPPGLALSSLKSLLGLAFARSDWLEVARLERAAQPMLGALTSANPQFFTRDGASVDRGRLANLAAYALAQAGQPDAALAVLEEGRATMLAERFRMRATDESAGPGESGVVAHLLTTYSGGAAIVSGAGDTRVVWIGDLGGKPFDDVLNPYATALDTFRDNAVIGFRAWVRAVTDMVAFLTKALTPLSDALPAGAVTLIPCGVLGLLPVGAALLQAGSAERSVAVLPSVGAFRPAAGRQEAPSVLVVADPGLASSHVEQAGISALFPRATDLPGEISADAIVAALPTGGVVHFACHASCDVGQPLHSALVLPGGEKWTVGGILTTDLSKVALTVLSACESGLTGAYTTDEGLDVRSALLAAGCPSVISTLWMVEDRSSALIMLRFYWEWRRLGASVPDALARAQRWQRDSSDADKCHFLETDLVGGGILTQSDASGFADRIREKSESPDSNSFAAPYFWAGLCLSGG